MDLKFYNIYKFHVKNFVSQILRHIRQIQIEDTKYFPSIAMIVIGSSKYMKYLGITI